MKNYREDKKKEEKKEKEEKSKKEDKSKKEKKKKGNEDIKQNARKLIDKIEKRNEQIINKYEKDLKGIIDLQKDYTINNNENENEQLLKEKDIKNNIEINFEKFSMLSKTKNYIIKFFNLIMPFKSDINYIKKKYNKTVLLTFKIYRFLFLLSIFCLLIYLALCLSHLFKLKHNLSDLCKYGIPCFLLYSTFDEEEGDITSITYGVWLMFFLSSTITFYFILNAEENEKDIYFKINNNHLSFSYLVSSWNFNFKNEGTSERKKKIIKEELEINSRNQIDIMKGGSESNISLIPFFIVNIIYLAYLFIEYVVFVLCFFIRQKIRENNKVIKKLGLYDIFADAASYLCIGIFLNFFVWMSSIFPVFEGWKREKHKKLSETIKKLISFLVGLISVLYIFSYITLHGNDNIKLIPFFDEEHYSFFGCPGKYKIVKNPYIINRVLGNYQKIKRLNYSECREEDTGIALLFIFFVYLIFLLIGESCNLMKCCCKDRPSFRPNFSVIKVYSIFLFYLIVVYFIPYLALLFPLIMLIVYKFQLSILKKYGSISFNENIVTKRNTNNNFILNSFLIFSIINFCITGYFYFESFPGFYSADCYTPKRNLRDNINILVYNYNKFCGPIRYQKKLSSILTAKMRDTFVIGWLTDLCQQIPFIIILLSIIAVIVVYRNYNPDKRYYNYILKRQQEIMQTIYFFYDSFKKGDVITSMLLKITKEKIK